MIYNKKELFMTAEQESLFRQKTVKKTGKYFWAALIYVLLFQVYNISYVLYYTDFRLNSQASKVYMGLYAAMVLLCAGAGASGLLWTSKNEENFSRLLNLYSLFGCALLFWSACLTLYDQRVSNNLSIYMTSAVYVAGLIYIRPKISIPVFILSEAVLLTGLLGMHLNEIKDTYGVCVNSIGLTLVAQFISLHRFSSLRREFLNRLEIEEKNKMILEQSKKLNYIANHDPLTGLWNRNYLNEWKEKFFSGGTAKAAVLILDIDHFKEYNDAFGHVAGDECLKKVADALLELNPLTFRFGGEEFLCLLTQEESRQAGHLASNLCSHIEALGIPSANPGKSLTVSVGYSTGLMTDDLEFRRLLHEADKALYLAKSGGRNQAVEYSPSKPQQS